MHRINDECEQCLEVKPLLMPVEVFTYAGAHFMWLCFGCRIGFEADEWICLMTDLTHSVTAARQQERKNA